MPNACLTLNLSESWNIWFSTDEDLRLWIESFARIDLDVVYMLQAAPKTNVMLSQPHKELLSMQIFQNVQSSQTKMNSSTMLVQQFPNISMRSNFAWP